MKSALITGITVACLLFSVACNDNKAEPEETIIFEMPG